jgi:urea transport system substrate-binding protein
MGKGLAVAALPGLALSGAAGCRPLSIPPRRNKVKVGILHSLTGTMSISETSLCNAELLAIEEINASGGILGHFIEPVVKDGRSKF